VAATSPEQRVLDGALRCIARWGVAKTTLDDVAREAACSRATVYRLFPGGKESVLSALVDTEIERFFAGLSAALDGVTDLEDVVVTGVTHAARAVRSHAALQFLLAHEPEVVLPHVSFHHAGEVLAAVGRFAAPHLTAHVGETEAPRVAEWVTRIVLSYLLCPADGIDVGDEESVRRLVRAYVLPGLVPSLQAQGA
jgi:AcrR family transcriptional regulator